MNRKQLAFLPDDIDCRPLVRATPPVITPAPPFMMVDYHHKDEDPWSKTMNYGGDPIPPELRRKEAWHACVFAGLKAELIAQKRATPSMTTEVKNFGSIQNNPAYWLPCDELPTYLDLLDIASFAKRHIGVDATRDITQRIGHSRKLAMVDDKRKKDLYNAFCDAIKKGINEGKEPTS